MARRNIHDVVADARSEIEELDVAELQGEIEAGTCTVIDIRDIRERIGLGVIPGAVSAPRGMLEFWFDPESPYYNERYKFDDRYVFHCAAGWRSALAAKAVQDLGYTNVAHLEPGFKGWTDAQAEVEDITDTARWVKRDKST
ncbi:MAG: rhodanese-like domain-containing protein [Acidimicrobiales bacterium]|mgnify:CR=1 FL=1|jgi:rhodanese-related sulfurtransferase|tara:strand:+ start:252 stop:677 length:426 start_codon:yes stop_codon:yes gene_type:complete